MIIAPKISTKDKQLVPLLKEYEAIEFQLLEERYQSEVEDALTLLEDLPKIKDVCFHLPLQQCNILVVLSSDKLLSRFTHLLEMLAYTHRRLNYHFQIILHCRCTAEEFEDADCSGKLISLCHRFSGKGVTILLENNTPDLGCWEHDLFRKLFPTTLPMLEPCYDVCHGKISRRILGELSDPSKRIMSCVHHVHFSDAINGDGYIDKRNTHGRMHCTQQDVNGDLRWLETLGVNLREARIIAEINEDDYTRRPDMFRELEMLKAASLVRR